MSSCATCHHELASQGMTWNSQAVSTSSTTITVRTMTTNAVERHWSTSATGWQLPDAILSGFFSESVDEEDERERRSVVRGVETELAVTVVWFVSDRTDTVTSLAAPDACCCVFRDAGCLSDPGHGELRGPWRWTVSSDACVLKTARQTEHLPLPLRLLEPHLMQNIIIISRLWRYQVP